MARLVLKLPNRLAERIEQEAEKAEMLPTEYVRDVLRNFLTGDIVHANEIQCPKCETFYSVKHKTEKEDADNE